MSLTETWYIGLLKAHQLIAIIMLILRNAEIVIISSLSAFS